MVTRLPSNKGFSRFSRKILLFLKKLINEKIFGITFAIKRLHSLLLLDIPFPSEMQTVLKNGFPQFSQKTSFFEKISKWKNIQNLICNKKIYYFFSHKLTAFAKKMRFLKFPGKYCFFRKHRLIRKYLALHLCQKKGCQTFHSL